MLLKCFCKSAELDCVFLHFLMKATHDYWEQFASQESFSYKIYYVENIMAFKCKLMQQRSWWEKSKILAITKKCWQLLANSQKNPGYISLHSWSYKNGERYWKKNNSIPSFCSTLLVWWCNRRLLGQKRGFESSFSLVSKKSYLVKDIHFQQCSLLSLYTYGGKGEQKNNCLLQSQARVESYMLNLKQLNLRLFNTFFGKKFEFLWLFWRIPFAPIN